MPAADLVAEWFSADLLQAAIAARGIFGVGQGPWSAGTGAVLLLNAAVDPAPGGSSVTVKGGPGALTRAMADARAEAGAEIRTGASVAQVIRAMARPPASSSTTARELARRRSSRTPIRSDAARAGRSHRARPGFLTRIRNYRSPGTTAKVNLALSALPTFTGSANSACAAGRTRSARASTTSSAPSTRRNTARSRPIRISTSRSRRCTIRRSRRPARTSCRSTSVRALSARGNGLLV